MSISSLDYVREHCRSAIRCVPTVADQAAIIVVPTGLYRNMVDHMWRSLPHEGVGLLATSAVGVSLVANQFYAGTNTDRSATRYTMDPLDVSFALSDMRHRGARLGAIVHSHPRTAPVPSVTDSAEATIPGVLSLIFGVYSDGSCASLESDIR